jgi:PAS domain S-box-containing protein
MKHLEREKEPGEEIKNREERYRTLIEEAFDGIFVQKGPEIVFANQRLYDMLGYRDGELVGMDHWLVYTPEYQEITRERAKARMRGEKVVSRYEVKLQRKDGAWLYGEINAGAISFAGDPGVQVWVRDITERKRAEKELWESEKKYRTILETIEDGYYEVDIAGNLTFFNDSLSRILGYSEDELMGVNYRQYTLPDDAKRVYQVYNQVYRTGKPDKGFGWEVIRKDGSKIYTENSVSLVRGSEGQPIGFSGIMRDITERKQAEENLRYLKEYNEKIVDSIPDSLLVLDRNLKIKSVNRTYREIRGISDEDVVGKNIKEVFPVQLLKDGGLLQAFEEVMETRETRSLNEVKHTSSDHPEKILNITVSGLRRAEEEEEEELILVIEDITERARLREEIRKSKDFMDTIFKTSVDMVVTTDERGVITFVNRAIEKTAGYKEEELTGRHVSVLYDRGRERAKDMMGILTSGQALKSYRLRLLAKEGKEIPVSISGSLLKNSQGRVIGTLGFVRDVSELVKAEDELREKNKELENFVYIVSHDLKSPIVSMQGFSAMLLNEYREKLGDEGGRYLERIRANASRMEVLISDLLALSRVGRVVGAFKDVSSLDIVNRVCNGLKSRLEENRIGVFIGDNLPTIHCDGDRIYQVFENLIVNAVKFMGDAKEPRIEIGYDDMERFHRFYVRDNGIGIDPKYHRKIFEIFQRLNEVEDKEGTGIGLVIVERIVKNHGGKVWVESEKGKGATFYFTLPKMPS